MNPEQIRKQRIDQLYQEFKDSSAEFIDPIYFRALELFPSVKRSTVRDYARAALSMIKKGMFDEKQVIDQIIHNCKYWHSNICKRETLEKYCKEKAIQDPTAIIDALIRKGTVYIPKNGYVGLTEPEKYGL